MYFKKDVIAAVAEASQVPRPQTCGVQPAAFITGILYLECRVHFWYKSRKLPPKYAPVHVINVCHVHLCVFISR